MQLASCESVQPANAEWYFSSLSTCKRAWCDVMGPRPCCKQTLGRDMRTNLKPATYIVAHRCEPVARDTGCTAGAHRFKEVRSSHSTPRDDHRSTPLLLPPGRQHLSLTEPTIAIMQASGMKATRGGAAPTVGRRTALQRVGASLAQGLNTQCRAFLSDRNSVSARAKRREHRF